ncbi:MAG TPA: hypothetical protein VHM21_07190 [Sphingomicrobium sp.]|nr:hypothetical protein [Sphingomicrobium sp.]
MALLLPAPAAGEADLDQNGDPSDRRIEWYTKMGMAYRDARRANSGKCYSHVGEIVICKRRENYRIDPRLLGDRRYDPDARRDGYVRAGFGSGR